MSSINEVKDHFRDPFPVDKIFLGKKVSAVHPWIAISVTRELPIEYWGFISIVSF
jgi:hypothetical protein